MPDSGATVRRASHGRRSGCVTTSSTMGPPCRSLSTSASITSANGRRSTVTRVSFSRIDPADVKEFQPALPARDQIRTYLLGVGAATTKAITEATELPYNTVRETLRRMEARREAVRVPNDGERDTSWGVPDSRHDTLP